MGIPPNFETEVVSKLEAISKWGVDFGMLLTPRLSVIFRFQS